MEYKIKSFKYGLVFDVFRDIVMTKVGNMKRNSTFFLSRAAGTPFMMRIHKLSKELSKTTTAFLDVTKHIRQTANVQKKSTDSKLEDLQFGSACLLSSAQKLQKRKR